MDKSLGSLGDSMGLTLTSAYLLAIVQLPVTFIISLNVPPAKVDVYQTSVKLFQRTSLEFNGTAIDIADPVKIELIHNIPVSIMFLIVSGLCAAFTMATVYIQDKGIDSGVDGSSMRTSICTEEYTTGNIELATSPSIAMWNNIFLGIVVIGHGLLAAIVCSPCNTTTLIFIVFLLYVSIGGIIQPKIQSDHSPNAASHVSAMYMAWTIMYATSMTIIAWNIPYDPSTAKLQALAGAVFLDSFLLIFGHTWDPSPLMQTIMNCRLLYTLAWAAVNTATCAMWGRFMAVPYFQPDVK